jgi:excisionase family DNA binding protein
MSNPVPVNTGLESVCESSSPTPLPASSDPVLSGVSASSASGSGSMSGQSPSESDRSGFESPSPSGLSTRDWMTVAEAAELLDVTERSVRRWAGNGQLMCTVVRGKRGPELRIDRAAVISRRLLSADNPDHGDKPDGPDKADREKGDQPDSQGDRADRKADEGDRASASESALVWELRARVEGAQLAARLQAERRIQAETAAKEERGHLVGEVDFLREQLQKSRQAEEQMRVLLGQREQTIQALAGVLERQALPPAVEADRAGEGIESAIDVTPRRGPWWAPWRRG